MSPCTTPDCGWASSCVPLRHVPSSQFFRVFYKYYFIDVRQQAISHDSALLNFDDAARAAFGLLASDRHAARVCDSIRNECSAWQKSHALKHEKLRGHPLNLARKFGGDTVLSRGARPSPGARLATPSASHGRRRGRTMFSAERSADSVEQNY